MYLFKKKYKVDYCGKKSWYTNAKDRYCAGEKVILYYSMLATDTDYSFWLEGAELMLSYDNEKGYVLSFIMPENDVVVHSSSRNSMTKNAMKIISDES